MSHEMQRAKILANQEMPFKVISPPAWKEQYIKKRPKLTVFDKFFVTIGVIAVLVFCAVNIQN